jgi:hypothetical protein
VPSQQAGEAAELFIVAVQHRAVPEGEHASSQRRFGKGIAYGVQGAHADAVAAAAGAAKLLCRFVHGKPVPEAELKKGIFAPGTQGGKILFQGAQHIYKRMIAAAETLKALCKLKGAHIEALRAAGAFRTVAHIAVRAGGANKSAVFPLEFYKGIVYLVQVGKHFLGIAQLVRGVIARGAFLLGEKGSFREVSGVGAAKAADGCGVIGLYHR